MPELVTDGMRLLMIARRPTAPIGGRTQLPPDAPAAYARSQLGPRTLAWIAARGWLDGPRVVRRAK